MKLVGKKSNRESLLRHRQQNYGLKVVLYPWRVWLLNKMETKWEKVKYLRQNILCSLFFQSTHKLSANYKFKTSREKSWNMNKGWRWAVRWWGRYTCIKFIFFFSLDYFLNTTGGNFYYYYLQHLFATILFTELKVA